MGTISNYDETNYIFEILHFDCFLLSDQSLCIDWFWLIFHFEEFGCCIYKTISWDAIDQHLHAKCLLITIKWGLQIVVQLFCNLVWLGAYFWRWMLNAKQTDDFTSMKHYEYIVELAQKFSSSFSTQILINKWQS